MTHDEYNFLKKWTETHPKQQSASPFPATEAMQGLITAGFLEPITRADALNLTVYLVVGYEVTTAGECALKHYEANAIASSD